MTRLPFEQTDAMGMNVMRFSLAAGLGLAALPLLAGAALADNREQVLLRLPSCSSAAEQRQYLDCYYAAVQPLRAELGLAPAPQAASLAAYFAPGGMPAPAGGVSQQALNVREEVLLRLTRCASIGDTRQYLDCYYAAVQPVRAELGLTPAPQAASYAPLFSLAQVAPRAAAPAADNRPNLVPQGAYAMASTARPPAQPRLADDAGATRLPMLGSILGLKSVKVAPDPVRPPGVAPRWQVVGGVDHIAARISKVSINRDSGSFIITLENGQVWQQVMNDDARQHWSKRILGTVATIAYGAGQTFNFSVDDGSLYKVERTS